MNGQFIDEALENNFIQWPCEKKCAIDPWYLYMPRHKSLYNQIFAEENQALINFSLNHTIWKLVFTLIPICTSLEIGAKLNYCCNLVMTNNSI